MIEMVTIEKYDRTFKKSKKEEIKKRMSQNVHHGSILKGFRNQNRVEPI